MQRMRGVRVIGTGMHVPPRVVTNADLEKLMDTTDEWIQQRTGIEERHWVDEGTGPVELAHQATERALEMAGIEAGQIDAIIVATLAAQHEFPGNSAFLQHKLGISECPCFDIRAQCTGFLYALQVGRLFVASGEYDHVLVAGAEVHSTGIEHATRGRDVTVIFGDGAGVVLLAPSEDAERGILSVHIHAQGEHARRLWTEAPGTVYHPRISAEMIEEGRHYPKMDGRFVFKHAVTRMPEVIHEALEHNKCSVDDVRMFLFHQANLRINEYVTRQLGIPPERTYNNIQKFGNCSAGSIPMLLDECVRAGWVKERDLVAMAGFGAGFTWGSALIRW